MHLHVNRNQFLIIDDVCDILIVDGERLLNQSVFKAPADDTYNTAAAGIMRNMELAAYQRYHRLYHEQTVAVVLDVFLDLFKLLIELLQLL